jgi:hypothetical protein
VTPARKIEGLKMTLNDHKLTIALDAFCKRLIEGSTADPTGGTWEELTAGAQHHLKERYLGPLFAASQVLDSVLCDMVRDDFQNELSTEGATRDSTMSVRGWLKTHGLWSGPDTWGES